MNIFIDAYLDNNLGDDLMVKFLIKSYPNFDFFMVSDNSVVKHSYRNIENVFFVSDDYLKNELNINLYLKVGGSIFQYLNWKQSVVRCVLLLRMFRMKRNGVVFATIGSNLGPFHSRISKIICKYEIKLNKLITVRDLDSFNIIKRDFKLSNVHLYDDFVFEFISKFQDILEVREDSLKHHIGITAYRSTTNPNLNMDLYNFLSNEINRLSVAGTCEEVSIFSFDTEYENDLSAAYHIKQKLNSNIKVNIIPYLGNEKEFINAINSVDKLIAIRFHGAILADILKIPYIPLAYSNKMYNYVGDVGHYHEVIDVCQLSENKFHIDLDKASNRKKEISNGHLKLLDELIEKIQEGKC